MIVLDCSAAVEMARGAVRGDAFKNLALQGETVATSSLFQIEVRNAFWKYAKAGVMTAEEAKGRIEAALELADEFIPVEESIDESLMEAIRIEHPVYDMLYATLARRNAATLFTGDKRLVALCENMGIDCVCEVPV